MKIKDIMTKEVISVKRDTPVDEIAQLLVEIYAEAHLHTAVDVMTEPVVCVGEKDSIPDVALWMARNEIKHVPVVRDETLVGMVTGLDIIRFLALEGKAKG